MGVEVVALRDWRMLLAVLACLDDILWICVFVVFRHTVSYHIISPIEGFVLVYTDQNVLGYRAEEDRVCP